MKLRQILYFVIPCFIWGSTWFAIKFQLGQVDPLVSVGYRFLIAGLLLMVFILVRKLNLRFTFREHLLMILQGMILFGFNYWLVYLAETKLASGIVAIIFLFSIFTNIFFNYLLLKGKIRREVMAGAIIALIISSFFENYQWGIVSVLGVLLLFAGNILALKMKPLKTT